MFGTRIDEEEMTKKIPSPDEGPHSQILEDSPARREVLIRKRGVEASSTSLADGEDHGLLARTSHLYLNTAYLYENGDKRDKNGVISFYNDMNFMLSNAAPVLGVDSDVTEFCNGLILWVDLDTANRNTFSDDGGHLTWFASRNQTLNSPAMKRNQKRIFLCARKTNGNTVGPYVFLGRVTMENNPDDSGEKIMFTWALDDVQSLLKDEPGQINHFRSFLAFCGGERGRN